MRNSRITVEAFRIDLEKTGVCGSQRRGLQLDSAAYLSARALPTDPTSYRPRYPQTAHFFTNDLSGSS